MIELAPSLLAADALNLDAEIGRMLDDGVNLLHFDVMDAHFVPNLSFGPALAAAIHRRFPSCRLDVHLMMDNPEKYIEAFVKAGAAAVTLHVEVLPDVKAALGAIRRTGALCGLSVKPGTAVEALFPYLDELDQALIMTVEPGFGGQKFMPDQVDKIRALRKAGFRGRIFVDGGVNLQNAPLLAGAGADALVMGTAYFGAENRRQVVQSIKELA